MKTHNKKLEEALKYGLNESDDSHPKGHSKNFVRLAENLLALEKLVFQINKHDFAIKNKNYKYVADGLEEMASVLNNQLEQDFPEHYRWWYKNHPHLWGR